MKKKKFTFGKFLIIYVIIWIVATAGISAKLWTVFAGYQEDYEVALKESNPDLLMNSIINEYYSEDRIVTEGNIESISEYETQQNKDEVRRNTVAGKNITYKRVEKFSERKPEYDILANDKLIGKVILKQKPESDSYGFHEYAISEHSVEIDIPILSNICAIIQEDDELYVNGNPVNTSLAEELDNKKTVITTEAEETTGIYGNYLKYEIDGFVKEPLVEVKHSNEMMELSQNEDNIYRQPYLEDQELLSQVSDDVITAGKAYIMNANQLASFAAVSVFLENNSKAFETVRSVQGGLAWAGKPDELEIVKADILELKKYNDDLFTVKTYYKIHRVYREKTYDEEMTYEWLYVNSGGKWLIRNFALAK